MWVLLLVVLVMVLVGAMMTAVAMVPTARIKLLSFGGKQVVGDGTCGRAPSPPARQCPTLLFVLFLLLG